MADITFNDISLKKAEGRLDVTLLSLFEFSIPAAELDRIGPWSCSEHALSFKGIPEDSASHKFNFLLAKHMPELKNRINRRPTVYVHKNSGIPLVGNLYFGITDKGSTLLEIKPLTGCNASCIFCSVGEGPGGNRERDFVVEKDYLVEEAYRLLDIKERKMTIYINPHGEPLLYASIAELVADLKKHPMVEKVIIITNGMMLNPALVETLAKAGLDQINLSLSSTDASKAMMLMGATAYRVERIKEFARHIIEKTKIRLTINPVYLEGVNDADMDGIIDFAKSIGCPFIGIQNYQRHDRGKKAAKELSWEEFEAKMRLLEKRHKITLVHDLTLSRTKEFPMPFKKGDVITAHVVCPGRIGDEKIAAAAGRAILVHSAGASGKVRIKILRAQHNTFSGEIIGMSVASHVGPRRRRRNDLSRP